nr:hypothetical protein [uncultured Butyrivibrio sp.]
MDIGYVSGLSGYDVQIKAGNCNISKQNWERNDFPFWKYFEEATTADCLNDWKAKGPDVSEWSSYSQNGAKSIGDSKITILMPESLKQKMDEDSEFAEQIMRKVSNWKNNYDKYDKAVGISFGGSAWEMDVAHQKCDYLIEVDENGDVENYTVTGPGGGTESSKNDNIFVVGYDDDVKELKKTVLSTKESADMYTFVEENEPDYISAMGILGSYAYRVKICE